MKKRYDRWTIRFGLWIVTVMLPGLAAEGEENAGSPPDRLRLEVVRTLAEPVISAKTPGTESIPGGFECGTSVKVAVDGKPQYHFFAHNWPRLDWSRSQLDHWISDDGEKFRHAGVLLPDTKADAQGIRHIYTAPIPFFHEQENRWYLFYGDYAVTVTWVPSTGTMWYVASKEPGLRGINGPYDFAHPKKIVTPESTPAKKALTANSMPFQVKDGRWAMLLCTDGEVDGKSGHWPIVQTYATSPLGPYSATDLVIAPMIDPTGYTENPMVIKVKGPKSGRDYWVAVFDFLAPEVTSFTPKNVFGFSWSEDGIHWPKDHGHIVNVDDGLPSEKRGWWRGAWAIRTPHQMIPEDDGTYTVFFTGGTHENHQAGFRAVGKVTVRLVEK